MHGVAAQSHEVTAEVADIGRRINSGDATCGWRGDPTMSLHVAFPLDRRGQPIDGVHVFEVEGIDGQGDTYIVGRWQECDQRILRDLADGDWQRGDLAARMDKKNMAIRKQKDSREAEARAALVDRMAFDLRREHGAHHGGSTRWNLLGRR